MATTSDAAAAMHTTRLGSTTRLVAAERLDRWIFVFMAALCVVTAVVGFGPSSLALLATVEAGQRPPLPLILHGAPRATPFVSFGNDNGRRDAHENDSLTS